MNPDNPNLRTVESWAEHYDRLKKERDAYAKAMAIALENGVFYEKERVKNEIEKILKDVSRE